MNERPMCWVHQADDSMVNRGGETDAFDKVGHAPFEPGEERDLRRRGRVLPEEHPDVALHLFCPVAAGMNAAREKGLAGHLRGDRGAAPAGIEPPAVIAALDFASVKTPGAQRHTAVWAKVSQS